MHESTTLHTACNIFVKRMNNLFIIFLSFYLLFYCEMTIDCININIECDQREWKNREKVQHIAFPNKLVVS